MQNLNFKPRKNQGIKSLSSRTTSSDDLRSGKADGSLRGANPIACPPLIASCGLDTIHMSLELHGISSSLFSEMKEAKLRVQSGSDQEEPFKFLKNGTDAFSWNIQRTGIRYYPYLFKCGDVILAISSRSVGSAIPNASLMIGSISSQQNPVKLLKNLKFWFSCIGITLISNTVSRFDVCADIKLSINDNNLDDISRFITRARDSNVRYSHRKFNSISWGSGSIMCRIYDKVLEMKQKKSAEKILFFKELWGGYLGDVTRVEFQLRRDAIKSFFKGKTDLETIIRRVGDVWQYLTNDWLRHSDKSVDRDNRHQDRASLSEFWQVVVSANFIRRKPVSRKKNRRNIDIPSLKKQALGALLSACAGKNIHGDSFFTLISEITSMMSDELLFAMRDKFFLKDYEGKKIATHVTF